MHPFELTAIFRNTASLDVPAMLGELHRFALHLQGASPMLSGWRLKAISKDDAMRYEVFDANGPTAAATAVLTTELKNETDLRIIGMWNARSGKEGASLQYIRRPAPETSSIVLRAKPEAFPHEERLAVGLVSQAAVQWSPSVVSLAPPSYFDKRVFRDRPGVGWMLYIPQVLSQRQVPEARALTPVMDGPRQIGTIVVSVVGEPFSDDDADHVKIANAIEIRLADQDLLPRYSAL
ncbi:hypothetical protein [Cupriavidus necator]|uniref:hypothetical protein n=1 Tax=Cupriavidus necator TaxID=106590 RepID=UPI00339D8AEB